MKLNKKGFTLVELLAVIVVLALLMVVAASSIGTALDNSKRKTLETEAKKLLSNKYTDLKSSIMVGGTAPASSGTDSADYSYSMKFDTSTGEITSACIQYKKEYHINGSVDKDGNIKLDEAGVLTGECTTDEG